MRKIGITLTVFALLWQGSLLAGGFPVADSVIVDKGDRKL
jgi:hypothetical protein